MKKILYSAARYRLQYYFLLELYNFLYVVLNKKHKITPEVLSIDQSIQKIIDQKCSVSRFGDGEISLIGRKSIGFQEQSEALSARLAEVLQSDKENHLTCIPDVFTRLFRYNRHARRFWRYHFYKYGRIWDSYLTPGRVYCNANVTRLYIDFRSKNNSARWFNLIKKIWDRRDIIIIEGDKSRLGIGNDLFDNVSSIKRVLCPAKNAFERYGEILEHSKKLDINALILIALGPTATILAYDLSHLGFQAIDIGHVDVEYEWFKIKAKKRVRLSSKYVNETTGGHHVVDVQDKEYDDQIIFSIGL